MPTLVASMTLMDGLEIEGEGGRERRREGGRGRERERDGGREGGERELSW